MPDFLAFLKEDEPNRGAKSTSLSDALGVLSGQYGAVDLGGDFYATKGNADIAHNTVMIVYRATTYISDFVNMIPWEIKNRKTGDVIASNTDPSGHPLAVAITRQYLKSKQPFFALWSKALSLSGENYIEPIKEEFGQRYIAIDWLPPALVEPYTVSGILRGFYYSARGRSEFFKPHELVFDHTFNAIDENRGWSPVLAAMDEVNLDRDSKRAFQAWFRNGMLPPVIFGPQSSDGLIDGPPDDVWDKLREQLKEKHRGAGNAYRSLVVNWPMDVTSIPQPDIDKNISILEFWTRMIALAYGLPPVVLGDPSATPYKTEEAIIAHAYTGAIKPQLVRMEHSVNIELLPFFDDSEEWMLEFDKDKYEKMGENLQKNIDNQTSLYMSGAISLQTYRQRTGATDDDAKEDWKSLPTMVMVTGIPSPVPLDQVENLWKQFLPTTQAKLDQQTEQAKSPPGGGQPPLTGETKPVIEAEVIEEDETKDALPTPLPGAKAAFISLDLANNETIKQIQDEIKADYPEITLSEPDSLHLTLMHMPGMEEGNALKQIAEGIVPRPVKLKPEGITVMGQDNALVIKVQSSDELKRLQYDVASQAMAQDVEISDYHQPDAFIPHITLGYIGDNEPGEYNRDFGDEEIITANDIVVSVKVDDDEYKQVERISKVSSRKAINELFQWGRFHKKASKGEHLTGRTFDFSHVRPSVERYVKAQLEIGVPYKQVQRDAIAMHNVKAIETTKGNFMRAVAAMITEARAGNVAKPRARDNFRNLNKNTISRVYVDGLEDAGIFEPASDETKEAINQFKLEPTSFVYDLMERIYSEEGITDAEAAQKPQAWWAGSISKVYSAGLRAGNENGMYSWGGDDGALTCVTCQWLDGPPIHIHRFKVWDANGLDLTGGSFVGQKTACEGGFGGCEHFLFRTAGRAQGGSLSRAPK